MTLILALDLATRTPKRDRYVYALFAGRQLLPCYIGIGKGDRMRRHLSEAKYTKRRHYMSRKYRTLRACIARGIPITARRLASSLTIEEACAFEHAFINIFGRRDLRTGCLLNACAGGLGVKNLAPSTRAKLVEIGRRHNARPEIRQMLKERKHTPETRALISAVAKGRVPSVSARAKMSASCKRRNERDVENWQQFLASRIPGGNKGQKQSDKARAKITEALKEQWANPTIRAKRSAFFKNQHSNPDFIARADAARRNRPGGMLGKKHSLETRAKMSVAHKRRRLNESALGPES